MDPLKKDTLYLRFEEKSIQLVIFEQTEKMIEVLKTLNEKLDKFIKIVEEPQEPFYMRHKNGSTYTGGYHTKRPINKGMEVIK
jgi:hypothetical protein